MKQPPRTAEPIAEEAAEGKARRRTPEQRPRQILAAALTIFAEQGLAGARIDDIADAAGIAKGTVYLYFPSKDDLFRGVIRDTFAGMLAAVRAVPTSRDATADLRAFASQYWTFLRSAHFENVYRLINAEIHAFPELAREYSSEVRTPVRRAATDILDRGEAAGVFRRGDNAARARMLLALLWQHAVWCARRELHADLADRTDAQVLEEILTFYMEAVAIQR